MAWARFSEQLSAKTLRGVIQDSRRITLAPALRPAPLSWDEESLTACWIGHSTVLVNLRGVTILTDPVLFPRVGANLRIGTVGPKRFVAPALSYAELPPIDLVLLSHAHMDHFDLPTLRCFGPETRVVTAPATSDLLRSTRLKQVRELSWGQGADYTIEGRKLRVEAFQVAHWGARWRTDTYRGYNGYTVSLDGTRFVFGGDTALTDSFKHLKRNGPYDMAIMPIGAYQPWIRSHCNPEQAVQMAEAAGATHFLPVHHLTFPLGQEQRQEPMQRLETALEAERIGWREIGGTFRI